MIRKVVRIGAALAAGALAAGISACSSGPPTTGLTSGWTARQYSGGAGNQGGTWIAYGTVVTGTDNRVTARSLRTGHTEWSWTAPAPPPGGGGPASVFLTGMADGTGIVECQYPPGRSRMAGVPDYEVGIDLATGRTTWTRTTGGPGGPGYQVGDGVVAELDGGPQQAGYVTAVSLRTGKPEWSTKSDAALRGCDFTGVALSGTDVYGAATCSGASVLYGLSARTGAVDSKVALHDQACAETLAASTLWAASGYLLLGCQAEETPRNQVLVLRAGTSRQTTVAYTGLNAPLAYPSDALYARPPFVFNGAELYLASEGSVSAINLASGRQLWQRGLPGSAGATDSVIGANRKGVLTASESGSGSVSLAIMSAGSGAVSYGPGTKSGPCSGSGGCSLTLTGHTLIATPADARNPITAYGTGAWPS